jgi:hypothetical protein
MSLLVEAVVSEQYEGGRSSRNPKRSSTTILRTGCRHAVVTVLSFFAVLGGESRFRALLGFCLKRMDGCFENRITAGDDVSAGQMSRDIGLDANTDELATVGKTVVLGTDASKTAAG